MNFQSFPLSSVWVDRAARQRRDLGDLSTLIDSIQRTGLINPLIIDRSGKLIAGERRFESLKTLGWSHATVQFREDMTGLEQEQLELDENIRRLDLPWQDRCLAMIRYHRICKEQSDAPASWRIEDSADRLGLPRSTYSRNLLVAAALEAGDKRIIEAPKFTTAVGILERLQARRGDEEKELLKELTSTPKPVLRIAGETVEPEPQPEAPVEYCPIENFEFSGWSADYSGPKFNFLHLDFPYGINADKHDQNAAHGGYADSEENYFALLNTLYSLTESHVAPAAHMIFWFSLTHYEKTLNILSTQWRVNPVPLIWWRSDNQGIYPDPRRRPRQVYETAFLCSRGDRFLVGMRSNLIGNPTIKKYHPSEKPLAMLKFFMSMVVDSTTSMLDPTCGSGNSVIAAHQLGAKRVLGLEVDPEFHNLAVLNWKENHDDKP